MGTRRAISQAFEIELGGMAFYGRGAGTASAPELKELCQRLYEMEQEHLGILSRRYHVDPPALPSEGLTHAQMAVYAGAELGPEATGVDLLELALTLEERARDFFSAEARKLSDGSPEWRLYRELEAEEFDHVATIATELERHKSGRRGLL
jgi:glutamate synthase (NADPH/NADH) small chain